MQKTDHNILRTLAVITSTVSLTILINPRAGAGDYNPYGGNEVKSEPPAPAAASVPVTVETGADGVQHLAITLDSYSFSPSHIIVRAGTPVEFTLNNVSTVAPHSFRIDETAGGLNVYQEVAAGKSATLAFTPVKPGIYEIYCDKKLAFLPSHRKKGMIGKLEVR